MYEHVQNLNQALLSAMDSYAEQTCFYIRRGKRFRAISYQRFQTLTFRLVNYFCQQGIINGERVAIIADNPLEWMVVYVAGLLSGGVVVPLRAWLPKDMLHAMLKDCGSRLAVVQGREQIDILKEAGKGLPELKTVLVVNDGNIDYPDVNPIAKILGQATTDQEDEAIRAHAENIKPDALALIYYKVGPPKGAVFDHARRLAAMRSMAEWFTFEEDDIAITSILSWSLSSLDAALHYFLSGIPHIVAESSEMVGENLQQALPTIGLTTPSGFEEFYNETMKKIERLPPSRQSVFQWALAVGKEYKEAGVTASEELRKAYSRADSIFFRQIRREFGEVTMRRIYSTGAPLPKKWAEFYEIINQLPPLNIYSLTEAGGCPAVSYPDAYCQDSCGQVAPSFQIRIADDGEVLVRGEAVMREYWQKPEETQEAFNGEGWLHTGDIGRFDQDGYLYLTGHKQPLIVLSNGRNIKPTPLEESLTASSFIAQAVVFGEGRPYLTALIAPDLPAINAYLSEHKTYQSGPITSSSHPKAKALIDSAVEEVNKRLDNWGQVKKYSLLDKLLCKAAGELTASKKPCREVIAERYADQIEALYPQPVELEEKDVSQVQLDPEELHELLEKQDILDAWMQDAGIGFLFDLARERHIDSPSMVHICDTAAAIAQMQNEEKPLSTALMVGNVTSIARNLTESEIQLQRFDHIRRMRQIVVTLAKMVDGLLLGYAVDKRGYVRGIYKLEKDIIPNEEPTNFLLGPQFRLHAALSNICNVVVFFVPVGGRQVRVFADGQLVGRYANGSWSAESIPKVDEAVAQLAERQGVELSLLQRLLRSAFQMSERNLGAIFVLGNADRILELSDPPEISTFANIAHTDIDRLTERELINFAKQDGATIIDTSGKFKGCMVLLRPDASTQAEVGPDKGARHSSAAKMSAEADCLAITVSQDGPITVYASGERVLSI